MASTLEEAIEMYPRRDYGSFSLSMTSTRRTFIPGSGINSATLSLANSSPGYTADVNVTGIHSGGFGHWQRHTVQPHASILALVLREACSTLRSFAIASWLHADKVHEPSRERPGTGFPR
jgi:hypothetical protein